MVSTTNQKLAFTHHAGLYNLLCRLDDLRDYRGSDQTGYGAERYPVQSADRNAHPDRISCQIILGYGADQYGGRPIFMAVMLSSAFFTWCLTYADSYEMMLLTALGVGLAGGSFVVGIAYLSKWYEKERQGTALGIYGMGNIGAAVTKFIAPFVMVAYGWHMVAQVWAIALVVMAVLFWFSKDEPQIQAQKAARTAPKSMMESLKPLGKLQVWRFSLYYFFVFGGFVALALWLPRYYVGVYDLDIKMAGVLAALFSVAGSAFRAVGGYLSDKYGAGPLCTGHLLFARFAASSFPILKRTMWFTVSKAIFRSLWGGVLFRSQ